jgi:hypothetical protein
VQKELKPKTETSAEDNEENIDPNVTLNVIIIIKSTFYSI